MEIQLSELDDIFMLKMERCEDTLDQITNNEAISERKLSFFAPSIPTHGYGFKIENRSIFKILVQYKQITQVQSLCPIPADCSLEYIEGSQKLQWRVPRCDIMSDEKGFIGCKWVNGIIIGPHEIILPNLNFFKTEWHDLYNAEYKVSWDEHITIHKLDDKIHGVPKYDKPHYKSASIGSVFKNLWGSISGWIVRTVISLMKFRNKIINRLRTTILSLVYLTMILILAF